MVERSAYVPDRGDVVWISLNPQAGHEQAGRRPAVVLSPAAYNGKVGLAILCPITNQAKGYPFEVRLPTGLAVTGVILCDQAKSLDWRARRAERIGILPPAIIAEALLSPAQETSETQGRPCGTGAPACACFQGPAHRTAEGGCVTWAQHARTLLMQGSIAKLTALLEPQG